MKNPTIKQTRQRCRLNICSWIDNYSICQFNQCIYEYWDGSAKQTHAFTIYMLAIGFWRWGFIGHCLQWPIL